MNLPNSVSSKRSIGPPHGTKHNVGRQRPTAGQQRANTQQLQILREENKTQVLPRYNCFDELRLLFKEKFAKPGHKVILEIDANKSMVGNAPRSLRRLMSDVGLHDTIAYANPGKTWGKTMKSGGSETNAHILATGGVLPFITDAGQLEYDYTYFTDHPSLFLNIDGALLTSPTSATTKAATWNTTTKPHAKHTSPT
jgi:hypothetical protein